MPDRYTYECIPMATQVKLDGTDFTDAELDAIGRYRHEQLNKSMAQAWEESLGVALASAAHPINSLIDNAALTNHPRLSRHSLETIEIDIPLPAHLPEVEFVYGGAAFNDEFGPMALRRLALERASARLRRRGVNRKRYHGMMSRRQERYRCGKWP